jgi:hypothetical protein
MRRLGAVYGGEPAVVAQAAADTTGAQGADLVRGEGPPPVSVAAAAYDDHAGMRYIYKYPKARSLRRAAARSLTPAVRRPMAGPPALWRVGPYAGPPIPR